MRTGCPTASAPLGTFAINTFGYVPSNPVLIARFACLHGPKSQGKLSVRTRTGYMGGAEPPLGEKGAR